MPRLGRGLHAGCQGGQQPGNAACLSGLRYSATWANRMPQAFAPYPGSRVAEAAGNDANGCGFRIVSLRTAAPAAKVIDYYYTRASGAGYSAEHKLDGAQRVLGGTRGQAAYMVYATAGPEAAPTSIWWSRAADPDRTRLSFARVTGLR